jgi:hypothetical protein
MLTRLPLFTGINGFGIAAEWHGCRAVLRGDRRGFFAAIFPRSVAERSETPPTRGRIPAQAGEGGFSAGIGIPRAISKVVRQMALLLVTVK